MMLPRVALWVADRGKVMSRASMKAKKTWRHCRKRSTFERHGRGASYVNAAARGPLVGGLLNVPGLLSVPELLSGAGYP